MERMTYPPLKKDLDSPYIRLLTIEPTVDKDGRLSAELSPIPLDHAPPYEALSYTWGDQLSTAIINCNGNAIKIGHSLYTALVALQTKQATPMPVWADALCINQQDEDEKEQQIQLMRQIYAKASTVVVWLGPGTSDTQLAMAFATRLASGADLPSSEAWGHQHYQRLDPVKAEQESLKALLQRAWFSRIWVIQEVALARAVTVGCGHDWVPWEVLREAANQVERETRERYHILFDQRDAFQGGARKGLAPLVVQHQDAHATDPKDKIYALHGLADPAIRPTMDIDYRIAPEELYRRWTLRCIQESRTLDIIGCSAEQVQLTGDRAFEQPTWVTNWSHPRSSYSLAYAAEFSDWTADFKAAGDSEHVMVQAGHRHLSVRGHVFDTIDQVGSAKKAARFTIGRQTRDTPSMRWLDDWATNLWWQLQCERVSQLRTSATSGYIGGGRLVDAYWQTLCAGVRPTRARQLADEFAPFDGDMRALRPLHRLGWSSSRAVVFFVTTAYFVRRHFFHRLPTLGLTHIPEHKAQDWPFRGRMLFTQGRVMARTAAGFLGLVPDRARAGDQVWLFAGGRVPYVVRRPAGRAGWELVGEAYIHGIMDGRAFDVSRCEDVCLL